MRNLIVLAVCLFALGARAAEPTPAASAEAAHAASAEPAKAGAQAAKPDALPSIKPNIIPSKSAQAQQAAKDEEGEADLNARIARRIAEMRANQIARAAAAARAKKAAEAKKREEARRAAAPPPPAHGTHWTYDGEEGPANWSKINVDWAKCNGGNRQSPIDIRDGMKVDLESITFDYKPTPFTVVDNGHTIEVNVGGGNFITVGNRTYELVQFHFHRPSEERINGRGFEMVVHLVHKDPEGHLAVLAVLLERGQPMAPMQTVWNNLPLEKNDVVSPTVVLDVNEMLPARREYYTYMGSLTTPPCTENVLWLVLKQPMQASPAQMALFARLYPLNSRPVQPTAGRIIKESN